MRGPWHPLALVALTLGCGARTGSEDDTADAATTDSSVSVRTDSAPPTRDAWTPPPPPPPTCTGRDDVGGVFGAVPIGEVAFTYIVAGIERPGSHACPRFFLRAGEDATFSGDRLEIQVPYPSDDIGPGLREGTLDVLIGGEVWSEPIQVEVTRADGLFDATLPMDAWRGSATFSLHDATTDLEGRVEDAEYCNDFPLCI